MTRYMGIDYGTKRVGVALSDATGVLAFPHKTLMNNQNLLEGIVAIAHDENIDCVVVGHSQDQSGQDNEIMKDVKIFAQALEGAGFDVHFQDEAFSSHHVSLGGSTTYNLDSQAAALILQRFLDRQNHPDNKDA